MGILDSIKRAFASTQNEQKPAPPLEEKELPESFYIDAIELNRSEKDRFFRTSPYSPLEDRINFSGLSYYPIDPRFRYIVPLQPAKNPEHLTIQTNTGEERPFLRIGTVTFEVDGQTTQLAIYRGEEHDDLFVPFRDATSSVETYGAGRYLEPEERPNGDIVLDFNLCYNPFCAYSEHYSCPLPPFENHLKIPIRAGEKDYKH